VTTGYYQLELSLPCAAGTVVRAYAATAVYEDLG
jgi:hypothetical protein